MAESKKDKSRKAKVEKFKQEAQEKNIQKATPKTHLVPQTEYQSQDILELPGGALDAIQHNFTQAYQALQNLGQIFQQIVALNIQAEKIKLSYTWNNGEIATPAEIEKFQKDMEQLQKMRDKQAEELQKALESGTEPETKLVTVGGQPLTAQNLEEENSSRLIV